MTIFDKGQPSVKINLRVEIHPSPGSNGLPIRHGNGDYYKYILGK